MSPAAVQNLMLNGLESATEIRVEIVSTSSVAFDRHAQTVTDRAFLRQLAANLGVKRTQHRDSAPCACAFYVEVSFDGKWGFYVPGGISDTILHDESFGLGLERGASQDFLQTTLEPAFLRSLAVRLGVEELWMLARPVPLADSSHKETAR